MIHPASPASAVPQLPSPLVYTLVATGPLPAFNPAISVKHALLSAQQARAFNRMIVMIGPLLVPTFVSGYLIRIAAIFAPVSIGRVLAPISPFLQLPVISMVVLAFRFEFLKVLAWQFEFGFLVLTATVWAMCFGWYLQDARAFVVPNCWLEFVCLLLVETYFRNGANVAVLAVVSSCFLLSLTVAISAGAIDDTHSISLISSAGHSLTTKDILVNTMSTILMLMVRLAYRKTTIVRAHKKCPNSTFSESIGYRCRTRLQPHVVQAQHGDVADAAHAVQSFDPVVPFERGPPTQDLGSVPQRHSALLHMRYVQNSETFDSQLTLVPSLSVTSPLKRWQLLVLYALGIIGILLSAFAIHPASDKYPEALQLSAVIGLGATTMFVTPFVCSSQRQLVTKLHTSFDFIFLYAQHLSAHICLCDVLAWEWTHCCALLSSTLWTHWVLTLDTITPVAKRRLGMRTEFAIPVLVAKMTMKVAFSCELLLWNNFELRNRLLWDHVVFGHHVQFRIVPFVFSRMFTVFIWCARIVYRILSRQHVDELIIIQGNVKYDYVQWRREQDEAAAHQSPVRVRQRTSSVAYFEQGRVS